MTEDVRFFAIVPTVFGGDGSPDIDAIISNIERIAEQGVRGVLLTGSYGEFQSLEPHERETISAGVVSKTPMMVMAGAAALNPRESAELGRRLVDTGAHQVMVSAPFAAELTEDDLERHFTSIATLVGGALVVYNNPVFGADLSPELLERITADPAYVAIKQGTKGLGTMVELIARVQASGQARVLAAADLTCAAAVGAGAGGVTSTNVWVFPQVFLALADPDVPASDKAALLAAIQPYATVVRQLGQPRAVKAAMRLRGYAGGAAVRHPYVELDQTELDRLRLALEQSDSSLQRVAP